MEKWTHRGLHFPFRVPLPVPIPDQAAAVRRVRGVVMIPYRDGAGVPVNTFRYTHRE